MLKAINPRLVYATGSGYGITGPDRDNLAMDFTIQAQSGIMSVTGFPDGPPVKAGPTLVDFMGGIHLYAAVMTALFQRERTGVGQLVEVAMQEAVYSSLASSMEYHVRTGEMPPRTGNRQSALASAPYNAFPTSDGWVAIHVVTEGHWQNLLKAMGREDLARRSALRHQRRARRESGGDRRCRHRMDQHARQDGRVRGSQALPHSLRAGAHRAGGDERSAHAWPRHAGAHRSSGPRQHRRADHAVAPARRRQGAHRAKPDGGSAQREIYGDWLGLPSDEIVRLKQQGVI